MKKGLRVVATITLVCFLTTQSVWGAPTAGIEIANARELPTYLSIDVPAELGTVDALYEAPGAAHPQFILHIQNAHANYDAQVKIKQLLEYMNKKYGFKTIFVEGASSKMDADYLRLFPDAKRNRELCDALAKRGELTGAELFLMEQSAGQDDGGRMAEGVTTQAPSSILHPISSTQSAVEALGIEKTSLYRSNYDALKKVFGAETDVNRFFSGFDSKLDRVASKTFTPETRQLIADWKRFEQGRREFMPFVRELVKRAKKTLDLDLESLFAQVGWPQISRLLAIQQLEKDLDKEKGLAEKEALIKMLRTKHVSKELLATLESFNEGSIAVGKSATEVSPREILERLNGEAGPQGFKFSDYPAFSLFAGYVTLRSELDAKVLFEEVEYLFTQMLDAMAQDPQQKSLLSLYRDGELLRKLLHLELNRAQWRELLQNRDRMTVEALVTRLKDAVDASATRKAQGATKTQGKGSLDGSRTSLSVDRSTLRSSDESTRDVMPEAFARKMSEIFDAGLSFYDYARQREDVFYQEMKSAMAERKITKAVLITGGFHTDGMSDMFRQNAVSYGIVTPRLSERSNEGLYRSIMMGKHSDAFSVSYLEATVKMMDPMIQFDQQGHYDATEIFEEFMKKINETDPVKVLAAYKAQTPEAQTPAYKKLLASGLDVVVSDGKLTLIKKLSESLSDALKGTPSYNVRVPIFRDEVQDALRALPLKSKSEPNLPAKEIISRSESRKTIAEAAMAVGVAGMFGLIALVSTGYHVRIAERMARSREAMKGLSVSESPVTLGRVATAVRVPEVILKDQGYDSVLYSYYEDGMDAKKFLEEFEGKLSAETAADLDRLQAIVAIAESLRLQAVKRARLIAQGKDLSESDAVIFDLLLAFERIATGEYWNTDARTAFNQAIREAVQMWRDGARQEAMNRALNAYDRYARRSESRQAIGKVVKALALGFSMAFAPLRSFAGDLWIQMMEGVPYSPETAVVSLVMGNSNATKPVRFLTYSILGSADLKDWRNLSGDLPGSTINPGEELPLWQVVGTPGGERLFKADAIEVTPGQNILGYSSSTNRWSYPNGTTGVWTVAGQEIHSDSPSNETHWAVLSPLNISGVEYSTVAVELTIPVGMRVQVVIQANTGNIGSKIFTGTGSPQVVTAPISPFPTSPKGGTQYVDAIYVILYPGDPSGTVLINGVYPVARSDRSESRVTQEEKNDVITFIQQHMPALTMDYSGKPSDMKAAQTLGLMGNAFWTVLVPTDEKLARGGIVSGASDERFSPFKTLFDEGFSGSETKGIRGALSLRQVIARAQTSAELQAILVAAAAAQALASSAPGSAIRNAINAPEVRNAPDLFTAMRDAILRTAIQYVLESAKSRQTAQGEQAREGVVADARWVSISPEVLATPRAFGTNGIRGTGFNVDEIRRMTASTAIELKAEWERTHSGQPLPTLGVAVDPRPQGTEGFSMDFEKRMVYTRAEAEVLAAYGFPVRFYAKPVGSGHMIATTSPSYPAAQQNYTTLMGTASHNEVVDPKTGELQFGFKVFKGNAPIMDDFAAGISNHLNGNERLEIPQLQDVPVVDFDAAVKQGRIEIVEDPAAFEFERLNELFDFAALGRAFRQKFPKKRIALNTMNGGASGLAPQILEAMGFTDENSRAFNTTFMNDPSMKKTVMEFVEGPGGKQVRFAPDPTRAWFRGKDYDAYMAQDLANTIAMLIDGDADRLVLEHLGEISPNQIGPMIKFYLNRYLKDQNPNYVDARTVPTTSAMDLLNKALGVAAPKVTDVGSKNFVPFLGDLQVGLEESGHIAFRYKGQVFFDHPVALMLLMMKMMADTGKTWRELEDEMWAFIQEKTGAPRIETSRTGIGKDEIAANIAAVTEVLPEGGAKKALLENLWDRLSTAIEKSDGRSESRTPTERLKPISKPIVQPELVQLMSWSEAKRLERLADPQRPIRMIAKAATVLDLVLWGVWAVIRLSAGAVAAVSFLHTAVFGSALAAAMIALAALSTLAERMIRFAEQYRQEHPRQNVKRSVPAHVAISEMSLAEVQRRIPVILDESDMANRLGDTAKLGMLRAEMDALFTQLNAIQSRSESRELGAEALKRIELLDQHIRKLIAEDATMDEIVALEEKRAAMLDQLLGIKPKPSEAQPLAGVSVAETKIQMDGIAGEIDLVTAQLADLKTEYQQQSDLLRELKKDDPERSNVSRRVERLATQIGNGQESLRKLTGTLEAQKRSKTRDGVPNWAQNFGANKVGRMKAMESKITSQQELAKAFEQSEVSTRSRQQFAEELIQELTPVEIAMLREGHTRFSPASILQVFCGIVVAVDTTRPGAQEAALVALRSYLTELNSGEFSFERYIENVGRIVANYQVFQVSEAPGIIIRDVQTMPSSSWFGNLALQLATNAKQRVQVVVNKAMISEENCSAIDTNLSQIRKMTGADGKGIRERLTVSFKTDVIGEMIEQAQRLGKASGGLYPVLYTETENVRQALVDRADSLFGTVVFGKNETADDNALAPMRDLAAMKLSQQKKVRQINTPDDLNAVLAELLKELPNVFKFAGKDQVNLENSALAGLANVLQQLISAAATAKSA